MNSREKGARGERELAEALRSYGYNAYRGMQFKGGEDSPDVVCFDDIHIECKRVENLNIDKAMEQAQRDCGKKIPAVFHRRNNKPWKVTMLLDDWQKLYKRAKQWKEKA